MYEEFIRRRIRQLRKQRRFPAKEMSLALEQNEAFISQLETGNSFPSLSALLAICEHLRVTPQEFFDEGNADPYLLDGLVDNLKKLDKESIEAIAVVVKKILNEQLPIIGYVNTQQSAGD